MATNYTPAKTAFSRVFLVEGRARADHTPAYKSCLRGGALDQSFGDVERIECPDPDEYGQFVEIGEIQGAVDRATSDLQGRYAADEESDLLRIARRRCSLDIQIHFGACTDPSDFNTFTKAVIYENARLTNYSTDELGALSSDANAAVNETADLSAEEVYEVLQLSFAERGGDAVVNPVNDVVICDKPSCGDCDDESNGCEIIFAVDDGITGSPGTSPDLLWSNDKGATWTADDISALANGTTADAVACIGDYVVVVSHDSDTLVYKLTTDVLAGTADQWTAIATGIVAAGSPIDIWSVGNQAWIVGDGGYVYYTDDVTAGVTVIDAGVATSDNLLAVHALSNTFAVAVGENDAVIYTTNGTTFAAPTNTPASGANLQCVWIKNEKEWWVGFSGEGTLAYTLDQGDSAWVEVALPGALWDEVEDIQFATDSVAYVAANKSTPRAFLLRSYDGGNSWNLLPEGGGAIPLADDIVAIAACQHDPNFVVGVGLGDDGADGYIVVGED